MAFNYTVNQKTALAAQMARQHKIKHRTKSWEWAETWKHSLTAYGTECVQREMKEMKPLFDLKRGCGQFGSDVEGDDLRERQEFKQHKHSSMLLRGRRSAYLAPQAPLDFYSPRSLSVSALQLDHRPAPNCHVVQQAEAAL